MESFAEVQLIPPWDFSWLFWGRNLHATCTAGVELMIILLWVFVLASCVADIFLNFYKKIFNLLKIVTLAPCVSYSF